jgi:hypothetical protein
MNVEFAFKFMVKGDNKMSKYFKFMQHEEHPFEDCIDYLWFKIGRFHFRWFLDCGEWFIYIEWWTQKIIKGFRLSGAGNMILNYKR